jgi:hypothetical protein
MVHNADTDCGVILQGTLLVLGPGGWENPVPLLFGNK